LKPNGEDSSRECETNMEEKHEGPAIVGTRKTHYHILWHRPEQAVKRLTPFTILHHFCQLAQFLHKKIPITLLDFSRKGGNEEFGKVYLRLQEIFDPIDKTIPREFELCRCAPLRQHPASTTSMLRQIEVTI
jgi:hypothetical protein